MKPLQIYDDDHDWLTREKDRTGVPIVSQIKFMVAEKRELENAKQTEKPTPLPVLSD